MLRCATDAMTASNEASNKPAVAKAHVVFATSCGLNSCARHPAALANAAKSNMSDQPFFGVPKEGIKNYSFL